MTRKYVYRNQLKYLLLLLDNDVHESTDINAFKKEHVIFFFYERQYAHQSHVLYTVYGQSK